MKKNYKRGLTLRQSKGFTLIELLVVIAIIGILASIILASLATAQAKGRDAKIKEQLGAMRSQAELYTGVGTAVAAVTPCPTAAAAAGTLFDTANNGLGTLVLGSPTLANTRCASALGKPSAGAHWAVAALTSSGAWCVDYTGISRDATAAGVLYTTLVSAIAAGTTACL